MDTPKKTGTERQQPLSARTARRLSGIAASNSPIDISEQQGKYLTDDAEIVAQTIRYAVMHVLPSDRSDDWIDKLIRAEKKYLKKLFGQNYDLKRMAEVLDYYGLDQVEWWGRMGLKVGYLPTVMMNWEYGFPGHPDARVRSMSGFDPWDHQVKERKEILRRDLKTGELVPVEEIGLDGSIVLMDMRTRPSQYGWSFAYDQVFMGPLMHRLRRSGKVAIHQEERHPDGSLFQGAERLDSRFFTTRHEWDDVIRPEVPALLDLKEGAEVRLETIAEAITIRNLYPNSSRGKSPSRGMNIMMEEFYLRHEVVSCYDSTMTGEVELNLIAECDTNGRGLVFQTPSVSENKNEDGYDWKTAPMDRAWVGLGFRPIAVLAVL